MYIHVYVRTFDTIFIPIASPHLALNLMYTNRPAIATEMECSLANLLVESNRCLIISKFSGLSSHSFTADESAAEGKRTTGALVIPSLTM